MAPKSRPVVRVVTVVYVGRVKQPVSACYAHALSLGTSPLPRLVIAFIAGRVFVSVCAIIAGVVVSRPLHACFTSQKLLPYVVSLCANVRMVVTGPPRPIQ